MKGNFLALEDKILQEKAGESRDQDNFDRAGVQTLGMRAASRLQRVEQPIYFATLTNTTCVGQMVQRWEQRDHCAGKEKFGKSWREWITDAA